jgi:hypothetical protein
MSFRTDPLKWIISVDFLICFVVIPVGILVGWLSGMNPFLTIPLIGIVVVLIKVGFGLFGRLRAAGK